MFSGLIPNLCLFWVLCGFGLVVVVALVCLLRFLALVLVIVWRYFGELLF